MNDDDLKILEQNVFREAMKDGFTELFGGLILIFAPMMLYQPIFGIIFVMFYIVLIPQEVEQIRRKYTYPRIGYVKFRTRESHMDLKPILFPLIISILTTGIAVFMFTDNVFNFYNWFAMFPLLFGMIMFGPSAYLVRKSGSKVYWLLGTLTSISGFITLYLTTIYPTTDVYNGIIAFCMLLGVALIIGGAIKFLHFIRTYPILDSQEDAVSEQ